MLSELGQELYGNHRIVHVIVLYILNSVKVDKKMEYRILHVQEQQK